MAGVDTFEPGKASRLRLTCWPGPRRGASLDNEPVYQEDLFLGKFRLAVGAYDGKSVPSGGSPLRTGASRTRCRTWPSSIRHPSMATRSR